MRLIITILILFSNTICWSQEVDSVSKNQQLDEVRYDRYFNLHYRQKLNQIKRTYPLALRAKEIIDSLDMELDSLSSKRKKKKLTKQRKRELKDEFTYLLKDLYVGEGTMLLKLIHRETGMTVSDILKKYRGKFYAKSVHATMAMYGHDTKSKYYPKGDDWIAELVIGDIESGKLEIDMEIPDVTKKIYKDNIKAYRKERREHRKSKRKKSSKTKKS